MKLNSTENEECMMGSMGDRTLGDVMLMTTLSHQHHDTTGRLINGGVASSSSSSEDQEEVFFVELNSREMPIDCPEDFEASVTTRSIRRPISPASNPASASASLPPQPQPTSNKNMIIKPLLSMLLKSGAKMANSASSHKQLPASNNPAKQKSSSQTIELSSMTETFDRQPTMNNVGEVNSCFVMDSSGEERGSATKNPFSASASSAGDKSTSSLIPTNNATDNHHHHQQQLLLSSPSSTSSTSLIKSEFINNLNSGGVGGETVTITATSHTVVNNSTPGSAEFNQNIVIKSVDVVKDSMVVGKDEIVSNHRHQHLVVMTSTPGSVTTASNPLGASTSAVISPNQPLSDLDLERMLNGCCLNSTAKNEFSPSAGGGLHDRIVMSKKMATDKDYKVNFEPKKLNNTSETNLLQITKPPIEVKAQQQQKDQTQQSKESEILNNLDYSKQSTNSIENNQLINNTKTTTTNNVANTRKTSSSYSSSPEKRVELDEGDDEEEDEEEEEEEEDTFDEKMLSDEGRFLLKKAQYYCVENLKLVNIEKLDAPLGATIKSREGSILISRIVIGGAAQKSGLLHENDEILEVNGIGVRGKTINDICDMLYNMQGIISFLIIPSIIAGEESGGATGGQTAEVVQEKKAPLDPSKKTLHLRAMFNYSPRDDLYIPCKELGLEFNKGDILHVSSQNDPDWWQAYKDGTSEKESCSSLARLIPSQTFQERRFVQMKAIIGDSFMTRKKREKGFCVKGLHPSRRRQALLGMNESSSCEVVTYEEVTMYRPAPNRKRPIVLIGPHNIGRHELRKRLMQTHPSLFEVAVPHTTRAARRDEIDGKDYHFLPRHIFEADIKQGRFIEHGEYEKNLYGTSREAIRKVIDNSKICVLNLYPQALKALRCSDLMPYVIYIGPPNLVKLKELKTKTNETYRESDLLDIIDKGREIEEIYGHYFDKIIRNVDMDKTYKELFETIEKVQNEENWVPTSWISKAK